jgi:hypothetical protein
MELSTYHLLIRKVGIMLDIRSIEMGKRNEYNSVALLFDLRACKRVDNFIILANENSLPLHWAAPPDWKQHRDFLSSAAMLIILRESFDPTPPMKYLKKLPNNSFRLFTRYVRWGSRMGSLEF